MSYNYNISNELENTIDSIWHDTYYKNPYSFHSDVDELENHPKLFDKLKQINQDQFLDFLITINADILTHVGTNEGFEGADEAAKYYQEFLL